MKTSSLNNVVKERLWTKNFITITIAILFSSINAQMVSNNISLYIDALGGSATLSGTLMLVYTLAALGSRFICGYLLDRKGRIIIMIAGCIVFAASSIAFDIFKFLGIVPFLRLFQGIALAMISTATATAIVDVVPKNRMAEGIGYSGLANSIATAIGPSLGLYLINGDDFSLLFLGSAVLIAFSGVFFVFNKSGNYQEKLPAESMAKNVIIKNKIAIWDFIERDSLIPSLALMMAIISATSVYFFLTLFAKQNNNEYAGLFFIIAAIFMVISRVSSGRLTDKKGALYVVVPGLLISSSSYLILAFTNSLQLFFIAGALFGFSMGMILPAFNFEAVYYAMPNRRGVASATYLMFMDAGFGIGSILCGFLIDHSGFQTMYCFATASSIFAIVFCMLFMSKKKRHITLHKEAVVNY